ncbi:MAG: hypothetical protein IT428_08915 [Planctomycetaceae bacterium]|nr:hypothetical protein [Planctomycetaceae bacterium]
MTVTVELTPQQQTELERLAASSGVTISEFVRGLVEDQLQGDEGTAAWHDLPYHQWRENFRAWLSSQQSRNPNVDDSRESIYD